MSSNGRAQRSICMLLHGGFPMEVRVAAEVRAAVAAGFDVDVLALRRPGEPAYEVAEGARVFRLPVSHEHGSGVLQVMREYLGFTFLAGVKALQLTLRRRYGIVQVHNPPDFLLAAAIVPRLLGSRVILDVHDLASDMFEMRFEGRRGVGVGDRLLRTLERYAVRNVDAVLTVHEPYRQELIVRGARPEDVTVVLNTLDDRVLPPLDGVEETEEFRVVYHGTVTPHYGVGLLIGAGAHVVGSIPNLRLEIYGEGDALEGVLARARNRRSPHQPANPPATGGAPVDPRRSGRRRPEPADPPEPVRALHEALRVRRPGNPGRLCRSADDPVVLLLGRGALLPRR
jgi:glycosyltransferase involved in cell wall biosynthesis